MFFRSMSRSSLITDGLLRGYLPLSLSLYTSYPWRQFAWCSAWNSLLLKDRLLQALRTTGGNGFNSLRRKDGAHSRICLVYLEAFDHNPG